MNFMKGLKAIGVRPNPRNPNNISEEEKSFIAVTKEDILAFIGKQGETTNNEICEALGIKSRTLHGYIKELSLLGKIITRMGYTTCKKEYHRLGRKESDNG